MEKNKAIVIIEKDEISIFVKACRLYEIEYRLSNDNNFFEPTRCLVYEVQYHGKGTLFYLGRTISTDIAYKKAYKEL